jgi:hypothetical protein
MAQQKITASQIDSTGLDSDSLEGQAGTFYLSRANHTGTQGVGTITGLATSATTDTTNASNIASGTLGSARLPAFTGGDVTSSAGSAVLTIANTGVTANTYNNVTVNAKGQVTSGSNAAYLTGNQTITLSGDATGSGTTAITVTVVDDSHNHSVSTITASGTPSSTTFLNGAGAWAAPSVGTTIVKASTTSRNTTTSLAADPDLQFTPGSGTFAISFCLQFQGVTTGTQGIKLAFNRTTLGSDFFMWGGSSHANNAPGTFAAQTAGGPGSTNDQLTFSTISVSSARDYLLGSGVLTASGSVTYALEWAQNSSSGNDTRLLGGSWIRYEQIA